MEKIMAFLAPNYILVIDPATHTPDYTSHLVGGRGVKQSGVEQLLLATLSSVSRAVSILWLKIEMQYCLLLIVVVGAYFLFCLSILQLTCFLF
eukprot:m.10863 g.10863  ORF g.10863 m.10863 type:complete len:93 (+) comp3735_c0_seq1:257-535(+)